MYKWRRHFSDDQGITTIETAIVLIPFIIVVIGLIESAAILVTQRFLDIGTANAARQISLTYQGASANAGNIVRNEVCAKIAIPFFTESQCQSVLHVGILPITGSTQVPATIVNGQLNNAAFTISADSASILLVRTALEVPKIFTSLSFSGSLASGNRLLVSGAVSKADPYAEFNANGASPSPSF